MVADLGEGLSQSVSAVSSSSGAFKRVVVKAGTALVRNPAFRTALGRELGIRHKCGEQLILVSSGAVAFGREALAGVDGLSGRLRPADKRAVAAFGQTALFSAWQNAIAPAPIGQVLVGLHNTESRKDYLATHEALSRLWRWGGIPVMNENDVLANTAASYGDNDRLAARIAVMMDADLLIILTDIDGFYTRPPGQDGARHLRYIETIGAHHHGMAGESGSAQASGGMQTKLAAAEMATRAGCRVVLGDGTPPATGEYAPLAHVLETGTIFEAQAWQGISTGNRARRRWIGATLLTAGRIVVDDGAAAALLAGRNLLRAGIVAYEGAFQSGEIVDVFARGGEQLGKGVVAIDHLRMADEDASDPGSGVVIPQRDLFLF